MNKPHRIERKVTKCVGDPCSKYGYDRDGKQFIADMQAHEDRHNLLWNEFKGFMKLHDVTPSELRWMFVRYYEEFIA